MMNYDEIKVKFCNGNMIKSLKDGVVRKYSGFLTTLGVGVDAIGYDSIDKDLIVYQNGILADVVEKGINEYEEHLKHIDNVLKVRERLGCTNAELLIMDYTKELKH